MKKSVAHGLIGGFLGALAVILVAILLQNDTTVPEPTEPTPVTLPTEATDTPNAPHAVVGVWEGRLAVFRTDTDSPDEIHDVFVASLPKSEQSALLAGIPVYDEVELQCLLEDYTG